MRVRERDIPILVFIVLSVRSSPRITKRQDSGHSFTPGPFHQQQLKNITLIQAVA